MARPAPSESIGLASPRGLELELRRALAPMLAQVRATIPKVKSPSDARALGAALRRTWPDKRIRGVVAAIMTKAEARGSVGWKKWERAAFIRARLKADAADYDAAKLIEQWSKAATAKITNVRDEVAEAMREDIVAALDLGLSAADLQEEWKRNGIPTKYGTLEGRIKTIAQHQISNLHAHVQAERARAIGATEFRWMTQQDSAVREAHRALHGHVFSYDDLPSEGLPGQPINCRCFAEVVIPVELTIPIGSAFDA